MLYGAELPIKAAIESYEDAVSHLRRQKSVGAFTVKSYNQQRRDVRQMIIKAGRELEVMVVPEGGSLVYMTETQILDGHTGVEHSLPVPRLYKDVVQLFAKSKVGSRRPLEIVGYGGLSGDILLVSARQRLGERTAAALHAARSSSTRARGAGRCAGEDDFNHRRSSRKARSR